MAAEKPTSKASATGGKPSTMPTTKVTTATPEFGNQPECMAARPTMISCAKAAKAA